MKTTLNIDDELVYRAKKRALDEGRPLSRLLEDALGAYLREPNQPPEPFHLRLRVRDMAPLPGIDFTDRDSLFERMENDP